MQVSEAAGGGVMNEINITAPHSVDLEEGFLGALIYDGEQMPLVAGTVKPDDFYIVRYQWMYAAMERIHGRGQRVDYVTVTEELRTAGQLQEFGGPAEVTRLLLPVRTAGYAADHAEKIAELAVRRRGLLAAAEIARLMHDEVTDLGAVMDMAQAALMAAMQTQKSADMITVSAAVQKNFDTIETKRRDNITGIPTGFTDLDALIGGLQNSDLVIVAGRPGMGKTSLMLSLALDMMEKKTGVPALFSLEMSDEQVSQRFTSMDNRSTVTVKDQRTPAQMDDGKWQSFTDATVRATKHIGVLDDTGGLTPEQLRGKALKAVRVYGATVILVDYLQLMKAPQYKNNRVQEVGYISHELKNLAKELRVPVIAAAQLNRGVENRQDKRPNLSDLRESGDIENDADLVMFLYRDEYYNPATEFKNQLEAIIAKHRHGPTGNVALYFDAPKMRVRNLSRKSIDVSDANGPGYATLRKTANGGE